MSSLCVCCVVHGEETRGGAFLIMLASGQEGIFLADWKEEWEHLWLHRIREKIEAEQRCTSILKEGTNHRLCCFFPSGPLR